MTFCLPSRGARTHSSLSTPFEKTPFLLDRNVTLAAKFRRQSWRRTHPARNGITALRRGRYVPWSTRLKQTQAHDPRPSSERVDAIDCMSGRATQRVNGYPSPADHPVRAFASNAGWQEGLDSGPLFAGRPKQVTAHDNPRHSWAENHRWRDSASRLLGFEPNSTNLDPSHPSSSRSSERSFAARQQDSSGTPRHGSGRMPPDCRHRGSYRLSDPRTCRSSHCCAPAGQIYVVATAS